jgi:hypothetical protein
MSETSQPYGERGQRASSSSSPPTTAWIPLEGRCEQWATLARDAHVTDLLQVTGLAFQALFYESRAHACYEQAQLPASIATSMNLLDQAEEALSQARQCWSDVISALEYQRINLRISFPNRELASTLLQEVWNERVRMTTLLLEVEQAQAQCQRDYHAIGGTRENAGKDE